MMSRAYYKSSDEHAGFLVVILVVCAVYSHKAEMLKIEHVAQIVALSVATLICGFWAVKITRKLKHWRDQRNPAAATIDKMTGLEFERYVAKLLKANGYKDVRLTEEYDLGIDIIAIKNDICWGIQVKRYSGLVGADAVRQVVTALKFYNCDRAMVVTDRYFSRPAIALADSNDCLLLDRDQLNHRLLISRALAQDFRI